ncbi:MAG TPA: T9SS type A sorting domain-containing protein [Bacteroidales bacterium]
MFQNRLLQIIIFVLLFPLCGIAQHVELKNNSFYIDGQKFFVKGIGYEVGATPGELPWARTFDEEQLRFDIQRIMAGGFNTIRTWAPFTAQELNILQQYNVKIVMGIWIDPGGNFADQAFVDQAKTIVANVLSYSKNYDNIIAYLIMNEPQPETIANAGYDETVALWTQLIEIIHTQHPNRPVSIANTSNGTYINPAIFDFSAYNVYIYNPVTVNYLHGYRDFIQYLNQLDHFSSPLIITEYGLSVSPTGLGNWGYGGNSFIEQQEGNLHMYKALVDGGAAGSCMFNYSDGWWKGGNEFVHDDVAEEWFGLINYNSVYDNQGQERPVWAAVKAFQSAIITQPRSSEIYTNKVPLEIFMNDTVKRIEILLDNALLYERQPVSGYLLDTIQFNVQDMKDATLVFNCYDVGNNLVKSEEKSILITAKELVLPNIQISIANSNFWQNGYVDVNYQINKSPAFTTSSRLDYIFYPHVGFNYGDKFQRTLPSDEQVNFTSHHVFASNVNVFTVGAAFDVTYNNFRKRIVNQLTLSRINDVANSVDEPFSATPSMHIYPNPIKDYFIVAFDETIASPCFNYTIINNMGTVVKHAEKAERYQPININTLIPGIYYICIILAGQSVPITKKLIKLP